MNRYYAVLRQAGLPEHPSGTKPKKPSIAVLPFASDDKEQEIFADGMTEELTARLSRFANITVIAQNSSSRYKGKTVDIGKVSRELKAHFILQGSVRRSADDIRVTVRLLDGKDSRHVWTQT